MANSYDIGDQVVCQGTFTDGTSGALVDPTNVFFQFKDPSGAITTYEYGVDPELQKLSTGVYSATVEPDDDGDWYYRFYSTGTGKASGENRFNVKSSEFD